jgi:hypothetical protein
LALRASQHAAAFAGQPFSISARFGPSALAFGFFGSGLAWLRTMNQFACGGSVDAREDLLAAGKREP